jgi:acetate kinase
MISKQNKAIKEIQTTFHSQDIETKVQYNINVKPYIQNKVRRYGLGLGLPLYLRRRTKAPTPNNAANEASSFI